MRICDAVKTHKTSAPGRLAALVICCVAAPLALAQPAQFDDAGAPPAPRLPDGTVDFSGDGVWSLPWITSMQRQLVGREDIPFLPWTRAMFEYNASNQVAYDPEGFCLPPGGPRSMGTPYPAEIIQHRDRIIIIFEGGAHVWREIHMDGRALPPIEKLNPTYFGHSVGHYEDNGSTLVVETHGFNESTWLNFDGTMHTDRLKTIERFSRPNANRLHYEATIIDPEAYSEPWTVAWDIPWTEGAELQEYVCQENNQFLLDLKDDLGNPFFSDID